MESLELPRARAAIPAPEPSRERCPLRLCQAFDQMADMSNLDVSAGSFTDVLSERISVLMAKYDTDGDGQISFDEFKAKATDMVRPAARQAHSFARPPQRQPCLRRRCRPWPWRRAGGERRAVRARSGAAG